MEFFQHFYDLLLESAPWLLLGLLLGGIIKTFIPVNFLNRHLSEDNFSSITKATLLGAPLPLCSCGVVPAAMGLRQAGASKPATVSFLISTPETGVDSVSLTYALLGPVMAIARLISALGSAFVTGVLVWFLGKTDQPKDTQQATHNHDHDHASSCCSSEPPTETGFFVKLKQGLHYALFDMFKDILFWLLVGLVFAALVQTYVPSDFLLQWGNGFAAMLVMLLIGVPMYVCATASTPIAVGLIMAGISPGVALVFLLSGPATNIGTLGIIANLLGRRIMWLYVSGTAFSALFAGWLLDQVLLSTGWQIIPSAAHGHETLPQWVQLASLLLLSLFAARIIGQQLLTKFRN